MPPWRRGEAEARGGMLRCPLSMSTDTNTLKLSVCNITRAPWAADLVGWTDGTHLYGSGWHIGSG
eukprot:scaffold5436_cov21-Tisochrysis_lutea.AAC.1